jgi:hypothetical protein
MADGFVLFVDVGPNAPLGAVAGVVADVHIVAVAASELAVHEAETEAAGYVRRLIRNGPGALLREAQLRELPAAFGRDADLLHRLERYWPDGDPLWLEELLLRTPEVPPRYLRGLLAWSAYGAPWSNDPSSSEVVRQLVAHETRSRLLDVPYRLRSLRYENPCTAEILAAGGAATAALTALLVVVRDWGPRRRRETARADAEERIQAAAARDAEDEAWARAEARRLLLGAIQRGELHVTPDVLGNLLTSNVVAAIGRLADRELATQRIELPEEPPE